MARCGWNCCDGDCGNACSMASCGNCGRCCKCPPGPPEAEDAEDGDDEEEFDCHMDIHGYCGKAGTEECDFMCPYRNEKRN